MSFVTGDPLLVPRGQSPLVEQKSCAILKLQVGKQAQGFTACPWLGAELELKAASCCLGLLALPWPPAPGPSALCPHSDLSPRSQ